MSDQPSSDLVIDLSWHRVPRHRRDLLHPGWDHEEAAKRAGPPPPENWPSFKWETSRCPATPTVEAFLAWLDERIESFQHLQGLYHNAIEHWPSVHGPVVRDAYHMLEHLRGLGLTQMQNDDPTGARQDWNAHEAEVALAHLRDRLARKDSNVEPPSEVLTFLPGGFVYCGHEVPLKGKPLLVLKALANARRRTCTAQDLLDTVWAGEAIEISTIGSHVCMARAALREAIRAAWVTDHRDPIPTVDRGAGLAWKLDLPSPAAQPE